MNSNDERNLPAVPEGGSMQAWAEELVARAREEGWSWWVRVAC